MVVGRAAVCVWWSARRRPRTGYVMPTRQFSLSLLLGPPSCPLPAALRPTANTGRCTRSQLQLRSAQRSRSSSRRQGAPPGLSLVGDYCCAICASRSLADPDPLPAGAGLPAWQAAAGVHAKQENGQALRPVQAFGRTAAGRRNSCFDVIHSRCALAS